MNSRTRAIAEVVAAAVALLAFVATSPPPGEAEPVPDPEVPQPEPQELSAEVVLHNGLPEDAVIRLRRLADAVDVDCAALLSEPATLLSAPLLGPTQSWTIPAGDNLGLDATTGRGCEVIRLEGDGFAPRWAVWEVGVRAPQIYVASEEPTGQSVLRLVPEGSGSRLEGPADLLFVPEDPARGTEQCAPVADGQRVEWGDPLPTGGLLMDASWGPDGCGSIVFSSDGEELEAPWYVCVPEASWPFEPGDRISMAPLFGSGSEAIELTAADEAGVVERSMQVFRSSEVPSIVGLELWYEPLEACGYDVEDRCGTVSRAGAVVLTPSEQDPIRLATGESVEGLQLTGSTLRTRVEVLSAQARHALDPECALGPDVLGPDLAIVVTHDETEVE